MSDNRPTPFSSHAVLRELFAALGNDPFVIAEGLARPALAERLLTNRYAYDQTIHGDVKHRAETQLPIIGSIDQMKQTGGMYREIELLKATIFLTKSTGAPHAV